MKGIHIFTILAAMAMSTACGKEDPEEKGGRNISGIYDGYEAVCLGTKSYDGRLLSWATMNIGASSVDDAGDLFAWGEVEAWKSEYSWDNYRFGKYDSSAGPNFGLSKYNAGDATTHRKDSKFGVWEATRLLDPEDDAVSVLWGARWRTPSMSEWYCLLTDTRLEWKKQTVTNSNGKTVFTGYTVTSHIKGFEGNSIFLPASHIVQGTQERGKTELCFFWTSSVDMPSMQDACFVRIQANGTHDWNKGARYTGIAIRPVTAVD